MSLIGPLEKEGTALLIGNTWLLTNIVRMGLSISLSHNVPSLLVKSFHLIHKKVLFHSVPWASMTVSVQIMKMTEMRIQRDGGVDACLIRLVKLCLDNDCLRLNFVNWLTQNQCMRLPILDSQCFKELFKTKLSSVFK